MLTVQEALALVVQRAGRQPIVPAKLSDAYGLVLAECVSSDIDSPPFDKALMDGYAVRDSDLASGTAELNVLGELMAGEIADRPVTPGNCWRIMTGAPLPAGAQSVIMVEKSVQKPGQRVVLEDSEFRPGQNVMLRGLEMKKGEVVLEPGHLLGPAEMGLLATVGHALPTVYRKPTLAILSTGDELVDPEQQPGPGQIRNSNEATILGLALRHGADVTRLGVARDDQTDLESKVRAGLTHDLLVLSGGVSAGIKDLVPKTLAKLGVDQVFHQVNLKPGKPVWFGTSANGLVFGLPGNPVSVLVCFELFVATALRARRGVVCPLPCEVPAELTVNFNYSTKRLTYHPARLEVSRRGVTVTPVEWRGSPDLRALTLANALLVLAPGAAPKIGDLAPTLLLRDSIATTAAIPIGK